MRCYACGEAVGPVFPGAATACTCGATVRVLPLPPRGVSPYRAASCITPEERACATCGHELDATTKACGRCARVKRPRRGPGEPDASLGPVCPRCRLALAGGVLLGVAALACGACGGAFVGNADLDALVREHLPRETPPYTPAVAARLPMAPSVRYLRCPACDQAMNRRALFRTSGVVVDVCTAHGTWLDEGELAAALSFVASGGLDDGRPRAR